MKKIVLIVVFSFFLSNCANSSAPESKQKEKVSKEEGTTALQTEQITLKIEGMKCPHGCAAMIEKNLKNTQGVKEAEVNFDTKTAVISYDSHKLSIKNLISVIENTNGGDAYTVVTE
ncbi:heavy-metal-associated domain-containing protein [Capnocytophaga sp. G2]|jgi:Copper chaperone|uniref:heavy-metal-associated domain-containing protein n=1 Tax=Capnocytophaga sp. G2 TaxID=3110695 RepID=UPI002B484BE7|nr:heavy-metal-associated domain-containing protein [Capnocytophaga sp. G2]MEB3004728.1 heavy-metal-associated domain-containing protein [Capnocytophaga sp. G2]